MYSDSILKKLSIVVAMFFLASCASTRIKDEDLTPQQLKVRQEQKAFNKTVGQGAAWGAAIGGIAVALLGGGADDIAKGAAIGAGVGAIGGSYFAKKQKEYANEEDRLAAIMEDVKTRNEETATYIAEWQYILDRDKEKLALLEQQLNQSLVTQDEVTKQLAIIREDSEILNKSVASTDYYIEQFKGARDAQLELNPDSRVSDLNQQIAALEAHRANIEGMVASINEDIENFPAG